LICVRREAIYFERKQKRMSETKSLNNEQLHQIIDNLRASDRYEPSRKPGALTIIIVVMVIFALGVTFYVWMRNTGKTEDLALSEPDFTPRARWKQPLPTPLHSLDEDEEEDRPKLVPRRKRTQPTPPAHPSTQERSGAPKPPRRMDATDANNRAPRPAHGEAPPTEPDLYEEQKKAIQMRKALLQPTTDDEAFEARRAQAPSREPVIAPTPNSREEAILKAPPLGAPAYGDSAQNQHANLGPTIMPSSMGLSMGMNQVAP
jgi:hypothetical protein